MRKLASFVRFAGCTVLALALASACGGKSFVSGDDDDDDRGGSSAGGTSSVAGTKPVAGKSQGGTSSAGGSVGTSGTGVGATGGGGYAGEGCTAFPDPGMCNAYLPSWYHEASTGICRPFAYGGCGGNANRYASLEDCQKACPGAAPNYDACMRPSDCVVAGTGCCGVCDSPSLTKHDLIAYNVQYQGLLQCGVALGLPAPPDDGDVACAPCPPVAGGSLKYFLPDCVQNQCVVTDLRESPLTECTTNEDCTIRFGTGCCQSCSASDAVALRKDANIEKLVCGDILIGCPDCATPTTGAVARCYSGRCELWDTLR